MIDVQSYVNAMVESVEAMKITPKQRDFVRAAFRASIEYANAKHGVYASQEARAAAASPIPQGRGPAGGETPTISQISGAEG